MQSYNAKDCSVTFNSAFLSGFAESMVTGAKDEELFSASWGAQGDCVVSEINNGQGNINITFKATSPSVPYLIEQAKKGTIAPCWVNNLKLGRKFGGNLARVKNYPELALAQEAEDVSFDIAVFDYTAN